MGLVINGHQLVEALAFIGIVVDVPEGCEELDTALLFAEFDHPMLDEDETEHAPGLYCSYDEYPEEGWLGPLGPSKVG